MSDFWDTDFEHRHNVPEFHRFGEALLLPKLPQTIGSTLSEGSSQGPARSDHVHTLPTGYYSHYVGSSAPSSPVEGQLWTDTSTDNLYIYNGSAWTIIGGYGAWTTYTPTILGSITNPNLGATGTASGRYVRHGRRLVTAQMKLVFGGAGVGGGSGTYTLSLPIAADTSWSGRRVGFINTYVNATAGTSAFIHAYLGSSTVINGLYPTAWPAGAIAFFGLSNPNTIGAAGDEVHAQVTYEAAGD